MGEEIKEATLYIDGVKFGGIKDIEIECDEEKSEDLRVVTDINLSATSSFECTVQMHIEDIKRLLGLDTNPPVLIVSQRRTHRKRRINKKWAKRYGYNLQWGVYET